MDNLKDYRISLKFSEKDSDHIEVVNLLKQLGRKKSSFIVKAIKYYIANNPTPEIPGSNPVITNMLTEAAVKSTIKKMLASGEILPFSSIGMPIQQEKVDVQEKQPVVEKEIKQEQVIAEDNQEEVIIKTAKKAHVEVSENDWLDDDSPIKTQVVDKTNEIPEEVNTLLGMLDDF